MGSQSPSWSFAFVRLGAPTNAASALHPPRLWHVMISTCTYPKPRKRTGQDHPQSSSFAVNLPPFASCSLEYSTSRVGGCGLRSCRLASVRPKRRLLRSFVPARSPYRTTLMVQASLASMSGGPKQSPWQVLTRYGGTEWRYGVFWEV